MYLNIGLYTNPCDPNSLSPSSLRMLSLVPPPWRIVEFVDMKAHKYNPWSSTEMFLSVIDRSPIGRSPDKNTRPANTSSTVSFPCRTFLLSSKLCTYQLTFSKAGISSTPVFKKQGNITFSPSTAFAFGGCCKYATPCGPGGLAAGRAGKASVVDVLRMVRGVWVGLLIMDAFTSRQRERSPPVNKTLLLFASAMIIHLMHIICIVYVKE